MLESVMSIVGVFTILFIAYRFFKQEWNYFFKLAGDKQKHGVVGFIIGIVAVLIGKLVFHSISFGMEIAVVSSLVIGMGKEIYDLIKKKQFDWIDFEMVFISTLYILILLIVYIAVSNLLGFGVIL